MNKQIGSLLIMIFFCFPSLAFQEIPIPFQPIENQPYFIGQPEINIDAEEFTTIVLKIKSNQDGTARLFWATSYTPQFNQSESIWFTIKSGDHDYYFNIPSQNPNWLGWITGLLIYPEIDSKDFGVGIKSAKITKGNLVTNTASGWQEFWGPRGRLVIGSTINTIQSSNLFGRSIFAYVYWLIALVILGCFAFKRSFADAGKTAFLCIVFFWGLLEISSLFNNWIVFKDDLKYFGKSYSDKLVLANTGDFYPFIEFCQNNLAADVKFDMRIPPFYNDIRARYYLYPREVTTIEAEYLVVYDQEIEKEVAQKYQPWKSFRDKAHIMRKR